MYVYIHTYIHTYTYYSVGLVYNCVHVYKV